MNSDHRSWNKYQPLENVTPMTPTVMSNVQLLPYRTDQWSKGYSEERDRRNSNAAPVSPRRRTVPWAVKSFSFMGLLPTTIISTMLLVSTQFQWKTSGAFYHFVNGNRATVQTLVQIISNVLGLINVAAICQLINHGTRISLRHRPVSLDILRLWNGLSNAMVSWELQWRLLLPLIIFASSSAMPSALWAGALTPVSTSTNMTTILNVPRYTNISGIKEVDNQYILRNSKGMFTYNIGFDLIAGLLQSASSASPASANTTRTHAKLDNTRFVYLGRSYGMGAPVGLVDDHVVSDNLALGYSYVDTGFNTTVECIYNSTSNFRIEPVPDAPTQYVSLGSLPDSGPSSQELSYYLGQDDSQIVAIGVTHNFSGPVTFKPRYLAIAAGNGYKALNNIQCQATFLPARFQVSVGLVGKNITVNPISSTSTVENIESSGNLTHEATRQVALMSQDETNLYHSTVGDAFESSISDFKSSEPSSSALTDEDSTLIAVENSMAAMLDDILVAYSSAQLLIANDTTQATVTIEQSAVTFGQRSYVIGIYVLNIVILLLVGAEIVRTRFWEELVPLDYTDPPCLVLSSDELNVKPKNVRVKILQGDYGEYKLVRTA